MKEIPRSGAESLIAGGQYEYTDSSKRAIRYKGNGGSYVRNDFGRWAAPDVPEQGEHLNSRPIEAAPAPPITKDAVIVLPEEDPET
jgi:hypothetical protein